MEGLEYLVNKKLCYYSYIIKHLISTYVIYRVALVKCFQLIKFTIEMKVERNKK